MIGMILTREQDKVLETIFGFAKGTMTTPVPLHAIHGTFFHMDVRDLVADLQVLLHHGLIENAGETREGISNTFVMTSGGIAYHTRNRESNSE